MSLAKRALSGEELASQVAFELPGRTLLDPLLLVDANVVITNVANENTITISLTDISVNVAAQVCANVIAGGNILCVMNPIVPPNNGAVVPAP